MSLKNQMLSDLDTVFFNTDEFADSIKYTPKDDFMRTIPAIRTNGERLQPYVRGPETAVCEYQVKVADVGNPQHGDEYTITSDAGVEETWEFLDTYDAVGGTRYIVLEREMS
jgi:hypothetical protein